MNMVIDDSNTSGAHTTQVRYRMPARFGASKRSVLLAFVIITAFFINFRQLSNSPILSGMDWPLELLLQRSNSTNHTRTNAEAIIGNSNDSSVLEERLPGTLNHDRGLLPSSTSLTRNGSGHPVVLFRAGQLGQHDLPRIPVVAWPYVQIGVRTAEALHIEKNGIMESKYLELCLNLSNYDLPVVWVADLGFGPHPRCGRLAQQAREAQENRRRLGLPLQWPVFVVDFNDDTIYRRCRDVEDIVGQELVWYSKRSIVVGRQWDGPSGWVEVGHLQNLTFWGKECSHSPLVVRTDTVSMLQHVLTTQYDSKLGDAIENLARNHTDVAYFWPLDGQTGVGNSETSRLRGQVAKVISTMSEQERIKVFVGLAGDAIRAGRRAVKSAYMERMLQSKIIVVVQRDGWEDHYRLFESMISGAMVMTDRMLSLPAGLENGTSIVEFVNAQDLRTKIIYYLQHDAERREIARRGRIVAMSQHRAWHRIEEVIFGRSLSICAASDSPCPWIVHAKEAHRRR